jgi:hypothetical protein
VTAEYKKPRKRYRTPRLLHASEALRERMRLVCTVLFNGSVAKFATAIGVNCGHLAHSLNLNSRVTVSMAAQVVSRTPVNARWLLVGEGPMLASTGAETPDSLALPPAISSSFAAFDPLSGVLPPPRHIKKLPRFADLQPPPDTRRAAQLIYAAHLEHKPVTLFLSGEFCAIGGLELAAQFVGAGYVTGLALTGCALPYFLPYDRRNTYAFDTLVKLAAINGVGLGESLVRWAAPKAKLAQQLLRTAAQKNVAVTAHVEPGEIPELFQPRTRGAEFGAQLGAATYVDSLVFAEQLVLGSGKPAGLLLACFDYPRLARLCASAVTAARTTTAGRDLKTFSILTFNEPLSSTTAIKELGGKTCNLKNDNSLKAVAELLFACDKVYAGLL